MRNLVFAALFAVLLPGCEGLAALGGAGVAIVGQAGIASIEEKAAVRAVYRAEINRLVGIRVQGLVNRATSLDAKGEFDKSQPVWTRVFATLNAAMPKWALPELFKSVVGRTDPPGEPGP